MRLHCSVAAVAVSLALLSGCGGIVADEHCGIAACDEAPPSPTTPTTPAPDTSWPAPQQPAPTGQTGCITSIVDGFEGGAWSKAWDTRRGPTTAAGTDDMAVVALPDDPTRGHALSVFGGGASGGYAAAAALTAHTTCFAERTRFAFDYRIDEGSLDASRDDHAEIAEITALSATGVSCAVLVHVRQGRLGATTGPRIDLGEIGKGAWTRLELVVDGPDVSFTRDGQPIGTLPMGCLAHRASTVRFSVSGGRSIDPGSYRAMFDDVRFESLP